MMFSKRRFHRYMEHAEYTQRLVTVLRARRSCTGGAISENLGYTLTNCLRTRITSDSRPGKGGPVIGGARLVFIRAIG